MILCLQVKMDNSFSLPFIYFHFLTLFSVSLFDSIFFFLPFSNHILTPLIPCHFIFSPYFNITPHLFVRVLSLFSQFLSQIQPNNGVVEPQFNFFVIFLLITLSFYFSFHCIQTFKPSKKFDCMTEDKEVLNAHPSDHITLDHH